MLHKVRPWKADYLGLTIWDLVRLFFWQELRCTGLIVKRIPRKMSKEQLNETFGEPGFLFREEEG